MATRVWLVLVICLGIINGGLCEEHPQQLMNKKRSSAVVVGTVYCDTCFNDVFSKSHSHFISGASVAVECIDNNSKLGFRQEVKTDSHGKFRVKLPFFITKHVKNIKRCSVKLLTSSEPYCSIASSATSFSLTHLKSINQDKIRVFSAGFFSFKPENQPEICSHKPIDLKNSKSSLSDPDFPPPIQDPSPIPFLPSLPPLPPLPSLPPLPPNPVSLHDKKPDSLRDKKTDAVQLDFFPPIPFLPPPSLLPPPSGLPPLPFQPPPAPLLPPLPPVPTIPVPGLTPPPSSPPPSFPIPLPPIFPGVPPAASP